MKKIININLSGRVIPIEDSAYEKLQAYIESLRRYFANEEGRDEIINDIEGRIAELLHEKVRKGTEAIIDSDIEEIITSMGRVEDFEAEDKDNVAAAGSANSNASSSNAAYTNTSSAGGSSSYQQRSSSSTGEYRREKSKLYRDSSDKLIGGVCSGIASYLGIDPAIVRILFAIITFGGFGLGFVIYILLWIILPPKDLEGYGGKRLYRNPDDKIISGVAGGLAAYFGKSSNTIRLIFAAPLLLNILFSSLSWSVFRDGSFVPNIVAGSLTGTFFLAYIVLWIVLPEASSEYQKMEMRGEKVDVNRIRQNVREGVENMKEKMKDWGEEVKSSAQSMGDKAREFANTRGKAFAGEVKEVSRSGGRGIGHIIGVLFKAFFLFIAGTIAFALFVALIGVLIGGVSVWPVKDFIINGAWQNIWAWGTLILFLGVPLVGFIIWILRRIMRVRSHSNYLGWTFGGLWALGWLSVIMFAGSMFKDFRYSNYNKPGTEMTITQPAKGKMIVSVSAPELEYSGSLPWVDIEGEGFDINRDTMKIANIEIRDIQKSPDSFFHVIIKRYSCGRTVPDAEIRAQKIQYNVTYRDSILDLGSSLAIDRDSKYRGQQIEVIIQVPEGKKIRFDGTMNKLHAFNIRISDKKNWRNRDRVDFDDESFPFETDVDYTMGPDGLRNPNGQAANTPVTPDNNYRYQGPGVPPAPQAPAVNQDSLELERTIEQKKNELKQLEEKKKSQTGKPTGFINHQEERETEDGAGPSPMSLLPEW